MSRITLLSVLALLPFFLISQESHREVLKQQKDREHRYYQSGQWANYGNAPGGMRHTPLDEITPDNVDQLQLAWTYRTGELETYQGTQAARKAAFEATPLMIDGALYLATPSNRVIALDAGTGKERWVYDPEVDLGKGYSEITCRGVSKWIDSGKQPGEEGYLRILVATIDGRLIALDAATGQPVASFGQKGVVDLKKGVGRIQVTSPPAVIGDLIVAGSTMGDNQRIDYPPGVVRAFDARSGSLQWSWDPIPRKEGSPGRDTWRGEKATLSGAANAWAVLSVDEGRDLVFVPTSSPSPDYYGGERKGDNLYANSVVALRGSTGEVIWHFQVVHHDLWDYDIPAQPALIEVEREGQSVPAVAVATKMGHLFLLHRETGAPLFPVEERPVPASTVPSEESASTQPFPLLPPPLGLQRVGVEDGWGPTPELTARARERIASHLNEGIFTPPSMQGTLVTPSNIGGMNWGGVSVDPARQILVTNTNRLAALITIHPRESLDRGDIELEFSRAELGRQEGTPFVMTRDYLITETEEGDMVMQTAPPWGTLAGIDLHTGQIKWEVPLGLMMDPGRQPEAVKWGSLNMGGALTTAGGLTFIAATLDGFFRAFNTETGELLWQTQLPAGGQSVPMSYHHDGKQYIVIAAGGHGKLGTPLGDYILAFALPEE